MVKTRSGAGESAKSSKSEAPSKTITKEPPRKRLLSMNDFTEVVMDFGEKLTPPAKNICILPKFSSELQTSGQASPSFTPLNNTIESPRPCWTPLPEDQRRISLSVPKVDAVLVSLQKNAPSEPAWVKRYEFFVQDAPIGALPDEILRKWLGKVFSSGMPWMGALSQLPMSLRIQARKIMFSKHAEPYL